MRDIIRLSLGVRSGATRHAILVGRYALKVPNVRNGWEMFLCGILGNIQEQKFSGSDLIFCPIVFSIWGGWFNVMRRASPMSEDDFDRLVTDDFMQSHSMIVPCEIKVSSFGYIEGKVVCVDYGS